MSLADQTHISNRPDIITPRSAIRLPGIPGEVMWHAQLDVQKARLKVLEIEFPNGAVDTVTFDETKGVSVLRIHENETVKLTPSMTRQTLVHARIISGLHLQLAIEKVTTHGH